MNNLGDLSSVGGSIFFDNSKIKSLNHLKRVEKDISFTNSMIENLGELEYVGGCIKGLNPEIDISRLKKTDNVVSKETNHQMDESSFFVDIMNL